MIKAAKKELYRELFSLGAFAMAGFAIGVWQSNFVAGLVFSMLVYLALHLQQLFRLLNWVASEPGTPVPQGRGGWVFVFDRLFSMQRAHVRERERLQEQADYMRQALSSLSEAVVMTDVDGNITWCNQAAGRLLGLYYPNHLGQLLTELLPAPEFVDYFNRRNYAKGLELVSPENGAIQVVFEVTLFGKGNRMLFARDITKLNRLERMRVDFIANVSHELRTPLTVINGYLESIGPVIDDENRLLLKAVEQMQGQSTRMGALVDDLMWLSRLESVPMSTDNQLVNVAALLGMIVDDLKVGFGAGLGFSVSVEDDRPLLGQEKEIHSAFSNLINNACKYTPEGGAVEIRWYCSDKNAVLEVTDTGVGIAPEHLSRLTERFYRVEKSRSIATGGTGLGLAIVKHVLIRHQGELEVVSEPDKGSTFRCLFPLSRLGSQGS